MRKKVLSKLLKRRELIFFLYSLSQKKSEMRARKEFEKGIELVEAKLKDLVRRCQGLLHRCNNLIELGRKELEQIESDMRRFLELLKKDLDVNQFMNLFKE